MTDQHQRMEHIPMLQTAHPVDTLHRSKPPSEPDADHLSFQQPVENPAAYLQAADISVDQSLMMVTYDSHPQKQHSSKGNRTAITGFLLGLLSCFYLLCLLSSAFASMNTNIFFYLGQILFLLSPLALIMGLLGLIFSIRSLKYPRYKALAIAGLIFASLALAMFLLGLVYILISYLMITSPRSIQLTPAYPTSP